MPDVFDTLNAALDAKDAPARPAWTALLELHVECDCEGLRGPHCFQSCGAWPCLTTVAARGWRDAEARIQEQHAPCERMIEMQQAEWEGAESERAALALRVAALEGALREVEWTYQFTIRHRSCAVCGANEKDGHVPDCRLLAALRDGPPAIETEG